MRKIIIIFLLLFGTIVINRYVISQLQNDEIKQFTLKSSSFEEGGIIPEEFTCDKGNISPDLNWSMAPEGTESYVLFVEDPDAVSKKPFVHWIVINIPSNVTELQKGQNIDFPEALEGKNDSGPDKTKYYGPCPPVKDKPHRYIFTLFALKTKLDWNNLMANLADDLIRQGKIQPNVEIPTYTSKLFLERLSEQILDKAQITGIYSR